MRRLISLPLLLLAFGAHAAITGTVIDEGGKTIAGATIRAWATESSRAYAQRLLLPQPESEPLATATTSDAGAFSVDTKGTIAVDLLVSAAGRTNESIYAVDGDEPLTVILRPASQRKLRVEADGKPVAKALVVFDRHLFARTDAAGEVPMLAPGAEFVINPDYAMARRGSGSATFTLQKGVTLRGRVVNAKGTGVKAELFVNGMPAGSSGDDGAFTIAHAPSNWAVLRAESGNDVAVIPHATAPQLEVRLAPGNPFTGMLRDPSGHGVTGARVHLGPQGGAAAEELTWVVSDAKGNFAFDRMPARTYTIGANHPMFGFEPLTIAGGESTVNRVIAAKPVSRVRGRVVDEARKPVAGSAISVFGARPSAVTDQAGNFSVRIENAPQGMFTLTAAKRGYTSGGVPRRRIREGETISDVVVTLGTGFPLQVRLVDARHEPVAGMNVFAYEAEDARGVVACDDPFRDDCRITDAKGNVDFRVNEGQYAINITPPGKDSRFAPKLVAAQPITKKSSPLVIQLEPGVTISGKVVYGDGTLVPNVMIETRSGVPGNNNEPSADGTFTLTGLAPGKYTLTAATTDGHITTPAVEVTAPAANVVLNMPRGGRIEGRVTERGTGRPVTDFVVAPARREPTMFRAQPEKETHADDGAFVVENVLPGPTTLRATARGFVPGTRGDISVEEGRSVTGIEIQLDRGATVSGRVTGDGRPLPGVVVRPTAANGPNVAGFGMTDADGNYSIDGVPPGERTFEFRKQGYITKRQDVDAATSKEAHLDVAMERGRDLRGRVVDKAGAAIEGVTIGAFAPFGGGENMQVITGADGSFVLEGLAESRYNVQARKSGYVSVNERDVALPQSAPLTLTLDRGGSVSGRVTGLTSNELGSVYVSAASSNSFASAQTDASGTFTVRGVPEGRVMITASIMGTDRRSKPQPITVENGSAPPVEISFDEGYTVRGRVSFNGVPVTNGYVSFRPHDPRPDPSAGSSRINGGSYEVSGLAAGDYDVNVMSGDGTYRGKYSVTGSGTYDIDVHGATLRGRVVDAADGTAIASAVINVYGSGASGGMSGNAVSDSDGRFAVQALLDGKYTVHVQRDTYSPAEQPIEIAGGVAQDVEVRLEGGTPATFVVVDATNLSGLTMANVSVEQGGKRVTSAPSRSEEGVRMWLRPGSYTATANAYGYSTSGRVDFTVPGPPVRITLSKAGSLVVVAHSFGLARLRLASSAVMTGRVISFVAGGSSPIEGINAGQYVLDVLGDNKKQVLKSVPVTIVPGERTTVTLD
jgi:hypothetical protein